LHGNYLPSVTLFPYLAEIGITGLGVIHVGGGAAGKWRLGRGRAHARLLRLLFGGKIPLRKPHNQKDQCSDKQKTEHQESVK